MRIGIDVSQIVYGTGVSVYTKNLVENLLKIDTENEYVLVGGSLRQISNLKSQISNLLPETEKHNNVKINILPIPPTLANLIWNKLHILPIETFTGKIDVFHSSDWTQPPSSAYKVTTIHDLSPILYPDTVRKDRIRDIAKTHQSRLAWVKKEVDCIIAVSEATKQDITEYLGIEPKRIKVVHEAPGEEFKRKEEYEVKEVKEKYEITGHYLITVGSGPRKNHKRLIEAFRMIQSHTKLKLIIAGQEEEEIKGVQVINRSTSSELAVLYSGAQALVYPSLYEGFGLPILEAFACGCPVVTSNISSMPEIAGGAAVLVDPKDTESIAEGIKKSIKDRERLIQKGYNRVREFSWEKCARETLAVYKRK